MKNRACKEEYLEKAKLLSEDEAEVVMSRMRNKLYKRLDEEGISQPEMIGIQLEIESEQLTEWRDKMAEINKRDKAKEKK